MTRTVSDSASFSETLRVRSQRPARRRVAGRAVGRGAGVGALSADDPELHHLAGRVGVGGVEVVAGSPPPNGSSGAEVEQRDLGADRDVAEVDDHVGPLGGAHQQPLELHRRGQEAALGADLPERQVVLQLQDQEAAVAAVQDPEAVAALLDVEVRPGGAVDEHRRAEELRLPDRRDVAPRRRLLADVRDVETARRAG